MKRIALLLVCTALACAQTNQLSSKEAADGWLLLFDGESLFGWTQEMGAKWRVESGALVADAGDYGWLRHNGTFANYILKCDFRTTADGNSGLFLRSAKDGKPHETGYELQIFDKHPQFPTGSLVGSAATKSGSIRPGEWQTFEITNEGDHFLVKLDGKLVLDAHDKKSAVGHIGLQYNKDKKIEFRNIKVKPLGLQAIFNGKDLSGWHRLEAPKPPAELPVWTVNNGILHVEKGPGSVESDATAADFTLQLDIRANSKDAARHPNSGVFFRAIKGEYWSGYEAQIRNEYKDGDRNQPVDFGTGAIYRNQAARRVVSNDNEFFTMTINARGRHLSVWVNGFPVTDFEDTKTEGSSVRNKEAVLKSGVFSLQAHDPTTNLDFKNIGLAQLP